MKSDDPHDIALRYIYMNKSGKYSDLCNAVTDAIADELVSVDFINVGYAVSCKTWGITKLGQQYYEDFIM